MRRHILTSSIIAVFFISGSASLAAPPVLGVSPTYMEFTASEGGANPDPNILSIWRAGGNGQLNWTVTEDCNWLTVNPTSGKSTGEVDDVNVIVDISSLTGGLYNCQLTVDAGPAVNSPQIVDVNLFVYTDINLVGWWKFDDGSGSTAIDSSGRGNDGTLVNGPVWTTGQVDGGLDFDGSNDYVNSGNAFPSVAGSTTKTIMAWAKSDTADYSGQDGEAGRIVTLYRGPGNTAFSILARGNPATWQSIYRRSPDDVGRLYSEVTVSAGQWLHIALVQNGSNVSYYINGAEANSVNDGIAPAISNPTNADIGGYWNGYGGFFDGTIDDVRIYDRALSAGEIRQLCAEGFGGRAFNPNPVNEATDVSPDAVLSWSPNPLASDVNGHDVYFGTNFSDVNDATTASAEYIGRQDTNSYDPGTLVPGETYYWRIDEVNDPNLWKGDVWSFTTYNPNPIGWWKFDEGSGGTAYDSAGDNDGTITGASWTSGKIGSYALDFDGSGDYVAISNEPNFDFGSDTDFTVCAWIKTTATTDRRRIVNKCESGHEPYTGFSFYMDPPGIVKFRLKDNADVVIVETTTSVNDGFWHFVTGVADRDGNIKIYQNGSPEDSDSLALVDNINNDIPVAIGRSMDYNGQYFDGIIDDVRIYDRALSDTEIQQLFAEGLGGRAFNPNPTNGKTQVDPNVVLSWSPGAWASDVNGHDVYFGTNFSDVNDATTASAEYIGRQGPNSWDPCGLDFGATYYWRIDEVNDPNLWKGDVWSFTTGVGLIGWWKFDESSGTTAYDSAGDNDGTLVNGPVWTVGQIDGGLDFDGSNDYVNCGNAFPSVAGSTTKTIMAWAKSDTADYSGQQGETGRIVTLYREPGNTAFSILARGNPATWQSIYRRSPDNVGRLYSEVNVSAGQWLHIALVQNGSNVSYYINGAEANSVNDAIAPAISNPTNADVGGYWNGYGGFFDGTIDDVRIYDKALSAGDIQQLYREGLGKKAFNPNPKDVATDVSPHVILSWSLGISAASHDVYFGTGYSDVNDATTASAEFKGN
ncbi:MAG: LamG-like jellyroll fold domain-containing protein, partial [Planctomycetota bacterium]